LSHEGFHGLNANREPDRIGDEKGEQAGAWSTTLTAGRADPDANVIEGFDERVECLPREFGTQLLLAATLAPNIRLERLSAIEQAPRGVLKRFQFALGGIDPAEGVIGEPVHGVKPTNFIGQDLQDGGEMSLESVAIADALIPIDVTIISLLVIGAAPSFRQRGKQTFAVSGRQFQKRFFRTDRGQRVRHARAPGKATTFALWSVQ
jgi:hypothetical protein